MTMADTQTKTIPAKKKAEVAAPAEPTKPGLVFSPAVDIFETEKEITVLADMPGVKPEDLTIYLRDNVLTLDGDVADPQGNNEVEILREYRTGKYRREFTLSQVIDQSKIDAELKDGVLRVILPKVGEVVPRKITVKAG
jgi:HSP20 family molecular chaperone IbpA